MVARDVEVAIEITQHGISEEKARQKSHDIYGTPDQSRELQRQLERAREELELKKAVTEAMNQRQEKGVSTPRGTRVSDGHKRPPKTKPRDSNKDRQNVSLRKNYNWLVNKIVAPSTAARMYQQGAISLRELEEIRSCSNSPCQAAEKLIEIVADQPYAVFRYFKDALKETKQHDVYMTLADIDFMANSEHIEAIRNNYLRLLDDMDMKLSGALEVLRGLEVIDNMELETINSETTHFGKNEKLLSLLSRKSFGLFQKFIQALDKTGQRHLADILRNNIGAKPGILNIVHTWSWNGTKSVLATALLKDQLFVTCLGVASVFVYNVTSLKEQRNLPVPGLGTEVHGLATCDKNNCLYISDLYNSCLHRVDLSSDGTNRSKWTVSSNPDGLSVNSARNVLVAYMRLKKVEEYTPSGSLVREIKDGNWIWQAVELSSGAVALSRSSPHHGVSIVSSLGHVVQSYGRGRGSGVGQMDTTRCLTEYKDGYILVADEHNHRLLLMNKSLTEARQVPLPISLNVQNPLALTLDRERGRLYVGEYAGQKRVLVFDNFINVEGIFQNS